MTSAKTSNCAAIVSITPDAASSDQKIRAAKEPVVPDANGERPLKQPLAMRAWGEEKSRSFWLSG